QRAIRPGGERPALERNGGTIGGVQRKVCAAAMLTPRPGASPRGAGQERRRATFQPAQRLGCNRRDRGRGGRCISSAQTRDELCSGGSQGGFADKFATGERGH